MGELAMFPLGTVLMPAMSLPLHVFEPRYRQLVQDVLVDGPTGEPPRFGVVLIERGSEVGGGDVRTDVGTTAVIVEAAEFADGRYAIGAIGAERIHVTRWLPDDPYPRAEVELWPDVTDEGDASLAAEVEVELRRLLALGAEVGDRVSPATTPVEGDPVSVSYQLAALAPLGPVDRQRLLGAPSVKDRLEALRDMVADRRELLEHRLRQQ